MENPLFAALQSNFGDGTPPPPDTGTVRGLLRFCTLWLEGETNTEALNNPCLAMAARLRAGAEKAEQDLQANPQLIDSAREPMERVMHAYDTIADILQGLPQLAANKEIEEYREEIELFEQERLVVLDCNRELEQLLSGSVRLCPRCASSGDEDHCQDCGLTRLYPDPRSVEYDVGKQANLPALYRQTNQAYDDVMAGVAPLEVLIEAVDVLDEILSTLYDDYRRAAELKPSPDEDSEQFTQARELAEKVTDKIEESRSAVELIRGAQESFRMADLSRGWDTIFDCAVDIQRATQRFAAQYGFDDQD